LALGAILERHNSSPTNTVAAVSANPIAILRLPEVLRRVGKCRSGLYRAINAGLFPRPIKLSDRAVAWLEWEVEQWLCDRIAERDRTQVPA
jgi:prophage regulatory protein